MNARKLRGMLIKAMQIMVIMMFLFAIPGNAQTEETNLKVGLITYLGGVDDEFNRWRMKVY